MKLDKNNPNHARLIALRDENIELVDKLAQLDGYVSPLHVIDVKLALLVEMVFPGEFSKARVDFETRFEAALHEELEAEIERREALPVTEGAEPPLLIRNLRTVRQLVQDDHDRKVRDAVTDALTDALVSEEVAG